MEITRDVILDLLPLYLADEVSAETRDLVEKFLETDPQLAKLAKQQLAALELPGEYPIPISEETKMEAYKKTKITLYLTIAGSVILMAAFLGVLVFTFLRYV
jgi:hypothetical protein